MDQSQVIYGTILIGLLFAFWRVTEEKSELQKLVYQVRMEDMARDNSRDDHNSSRIYKDRLAWSYFYPWWRWGYGWGPYYSWRRPWHWGW